jgi:hypothetical protein
VLTNTRWGCPPGWICKPTQENCDFEAGLPDRNFYCAPNECVPAPSIPQPLPNWGQDVYSNSSPISNPELGVVALDSYFNMNPTDYGLSYDIFVVDKAITITSTYVVPPAATGLPNVVGTNNTAVRMRQAQLQVPPSCYTWCNNGLLEVQALGKRRSMCQPGSAFLISVGQCRLCIDAHRAQDIQDTDTFIQIAPQFQQFIDYCNGFVVTTITTNITTTSVSGSETVTTVIPTTEVTAIPSSEASAEPSLVPTTVVTPFTSTSISGIAPEAPKTLFGSDITSLTVIMPKDGTSTTLSGSDLDGATLVLPAIGASQTEIVTEGSSTYTTEVPARSEESSTSVEDTGSPVESGAASATTSAPAIESGNDVSALAVPWALVAGLQVFVLAL